MVCRQPLPWDYFGLPVTRAVGFRPEAFGEGGILCSARSLREVRHKWQIARQLAY
jgi:hypothetical protein